MAFHHGRVAFTGYAYDAFILRLVSAPRGPHVLPTPAEWWAALGALDAPLP